MYMKDIHQAEREHVVQRRCKGNVRKEERKEGSKEERKEQRKEERKEEYLVTY
jgi:hypothetical protein